MSTYEKYKDVLTQNYVFHLVPEIGLLDKNGNPLFFLTDIKTCRLIYQEEYGALSVTSTTLPNGFFDYIKSNRSNSHTCEIYYTPRDASNGEYDEDFVHTFDCNFIEFEISTSADGEPANPTIIFYNKNKE